MPIVHPGILEVRALGLNFFVLRDDKGLYVIDGGFIGGWRLFQHALRQEGWQDEPVRGVIVTHGHLDHILNVSHLAKAYGAWIAAPRLDADHYAGRPKYSGHSRVTGWLEAVGRVTLAYHKFKPDHWLDDGDRLEIFSGVQAVHLPGHTRGHMGFWWEEQGILFTGDLFVSYRDQARLPLNIFNIDSEQNVRSIQTALAINPRGVLPNHGNLASPEEHLCRLKKLFERLSDH
ncbi:Hydroxyacylglutathione hydrolase [Bremerella volcania]|uniref:Hydroxyacylglutathione hydrolase n=1 Tax=Bremerella volcania TaxID=2527984 RepID=A0A518C4Y7_9BACT|nr:MBL fold metallo-hydrolase [Bremerella volcania]QDU74287.1 Hydroxyacylglutathione hydrolase [Bremerella volcania]